MSRGIRKRLAAESAFFTASSCTGCKVHRWPTAFLGNECVDILAMRREWRERGDCRFDYGEIFFGAGFPFGESRSLSACLFVDSIAIYQVAKPITDEALNY